MKKIMPLLIVLLMLFYLSACANNNVNQNDDNEDFNFSTSNEPHYFTGTIEEIIDENRAIVIGSVFENNPEGRVFVELLVNEDGKFQVGDRVKVGFDGTVMESNPAKIVTLSVELLE